MCIFLRPNADEIRSTDDGQKRIALLAKATDRTVISLCFTAAERDSLVNIAAKAEFEIRKANRDLWGKRVSLFGLIIAILAAFAAGCNTLVQYFNYIKHA